MDASEGQQLFPVVLKLFQHITLDVAVLVQTAEDQKKKKPPHGLSVIKQNLKFKMISERKDGGINS